MKSIHKIQLTAAEQFLSVSGNLPEVKKFRNPSSLKNFFVIYNFDEHDEPFVTKTLTGENKVAPYSNLGIDGLLLSTKYLIPGSTQYLWFESQAKKNFKNLGLFLEEESFLQNNSTSSKRAEWLEGVKKQVLGPVIESTQDGSLDQTAYGNSPESESSKSDTKAHNSHFLHVVQTKADTRVILGLEALLSSQNLLNSEQLQLCMTFFRQNENLFSGEPPKFEAKTASKQTEKMFQHSHIPLFEIAAKILLNFPRIFKLFQGLFQKVERILK